MDVEREREKVIWEWGREREREGERDGRVGRARDVDLAAGKRVRSLRSAILKCVCMETRERERERERWCMYVDEFVWYKWEGIVYKERERARERERERER